jgi:hypothetical protein
MNTHGFGKDFGRGPVWVEFARVADRAGSDSQPRRAEPVTMSKPPLWHKNNVGFWLAVCVAISVVFSLVYRALH